MQIDTTTLTIAKARKHLDDGDFSARELADACLARIKEKDKEVHAFLEVFDDVATQATEADKRIASGEKGALLGIPIATKDNLCIEGRRASAGSKILEHYTASYDATVIQKLKDAGAVLVGRTNLDEFAMGSSTENSAFGVTKNPHDTTRVPGGSSGGSAAAVAYGAVLGALGSDTGGSIRQPASFCGVAGLKPTYGAVSRFGLIAMGSSLDQIGPFGKTVEDAKVIFDAIKGHDPNDATSLPDTDIQNTKYEIPDTTYTLGVPRHFFEKEGLDERVGESFEKTLTKLKEKGYTITDIELPRVKHSLATYYIIMPAEVSANLARFDGMRYGLHEDGDDLFGDYAKTRAQGFGKEVRRRILLGTYVLSSGYYDAYYNKANTVRSLITEDFTNAFQKVDAIVTPTAPTPPFVIGEKADPLSMYLSDIFTVPANLTGMPGLSVLCGTVEEAGVSLPVGFQIIGPHLSEEKLLHIGNDVE